MHYTGISGIICWIFVGLLFPSLQPHCHCFQRRRDTFLPSITVSLMAKYNTTMCVSRVSFIWLPMYLFANKNRTT